MNKVNKALSAYFEALVFATEVHGSQMYDTDKPYIFHLANVNQTLNRFGFGNDSELISAGMLHDVLEDTDVKYKELASRFGKTIADIVNCVTDEKGATREERHRKTYPVLAGNRKAIIVKLADRITNVEYSEYTSNLKQWRKYRKEYDYFRNTLYFADHNEALPMWDHLDRLFDWGTP